MSQPLTPEQTAVLFNDPIVSTQSVFTGSIITVGLGTPRLVTGGYGGGGTPRAYLTPVGTLTPAGVDPLASTLQPA